MNTQSICERQILGWKGYKKIQRNESIGVAIIILAVLFSTLVGGLI
jgi:hypothetical protein